MPKIKVSEATPIQLDWMVAKLEGFDTRNNTEVWFIDFEAENDDPLPFHCRADDTSHAIEQCENAYPGCTVDRVEHIAPYQPSTDWPQGGPIIERERISIKAQQPDWTAYIAICDGMTDRVLRGPTPLIAAMRCFCQSKFGDEVEIPGEL